MKMFDNQFTNVPPSRKVIFLTACLALLVSAGGCDAPEDCPLAASDVEISPYFDCQEACIKGSTYALTCEDLDTAIQDRFACEDSCGELLAADAFNRSSVGTADTSACFQSCAAFQNPTGRSKCEYRCDFAQIQVTFDWTP